MAKSVAERLEWRSLRMDGHLVWCGKSDPLGYGQIGGIGAHRVAWEDEYGPIPEELNVNHTVDCGLPPCIEVSHLYLGGYSDSTLDSVARGRHPYASVKACPRGHPYDDDNTYIRRGPVCARCHLLVKVARRHGLRVRLRGPTVALIDPSTNIVLRAGEGEIVAYLKSIKSIKPLPMNTAEKLAHYSLAIDGHLIWCGALDHKDYGKMRAPDDKQIYAHRAAWELAHGHPVPDGRRVRHRCGIRPCLEPAHLVCYVEP